MDNFQTNEGKLLYILYNLYKSNRIGLEQKNGIKDMLVCKDIRIQQVITQIGKETNINKLEKLVQDLNPEDQSPRDFDDNLSHTYKGKRPKLFKFQNSNFSKYLELRDDSDTFSSNKNLECRIRLYSVAADSC